MGYSDSITNACAAELFPFKHCINNLINITYESSLFEVFCEFIQNLSFCFTFQIIIDGRKYDLDINKAKKVKLEEFGVPVSWTCKYLFSKGILKSDKRYHSIDVEYMKKRQTFHIEVKNERILKLIRTLNNGDLINISGKTFSQRTVIINKLEKNNEKK